MWRGEQEERKRARRRIGIMVILNQFLKWKYKVNEYSAYLRRILLMW